MASLEFGNRDHGRAAQRRCVVVGDVAGTDS
jgi:hypothetical protein